MQALQVQSRPLGVSVRSIAVYFPEGSRPQTVDFTVLIDGKKFEATLMTMEFARVYAQLSEEEIEELEVSGHSL